MKKLPFGFASPIILLAIGLIVGIGVTFAYFQFKSKPAPQPQQSTVIQSTPTDLSSKTQVPEDETASWKTYTDANLKLQFKYPSDWKVAGSPQYDNAIDKNMTGYTIGIKKDNNTISILSCCASGTDAKLISNEIVAIGNKNYKFVKYSFDEKHYAYLAVETIINEKNNKEYSALITLEKTSDQEIMDQVRKILSTFKFE